MKSQKGITLTSLTIYILLVLVIVGILATITANFQSNIKDMNDEGVSSSEIDKFNVYFLREVKRQGNEVDSISDSEVIFKTENKYTFKDEAIYLNDNIKIAENIEKCNFSSSIVNGKEVITVNIKAFNVEEREIEYVLSNEEPSSPYDDEESYIKNTTINEVDAQNLDEINDNEIENTDINQNINTEILDNNIVSNNNNV